MYIHGGVLFSSGVVFFGGFFLPRVFIVFFTWIFRGIATTHRRRDPVISMTPFRPQLHHDFEDSFGKYQAGILHHAQLEITFHMSLVR